MYYIHKNSYNADKNARRKTDAEKTSKLAGKTYLMLFFEVGKCLKSN